MISRNLSPLLLLIPLSLAAPAEAEAGSVHVRVAPVHVDLTLGNVTVSGTVGTHKVVRKPRPKAVYIPAHYAWNVRMSRVVLVPAGYKVPPRAGAKWATGHWAGHGRSRHWVRGHWA